MGDVLTLATVDGVKRRPAVLGALKWALSQVDFESLLVTDDRAVVHIGRVWEWLLSRSMDANGRLLAWRRPGAGESATITGDELLAASSEGVSRARGSASRPLRPHDVVSSQPASKAASAGSAASSMSEAHSVWISVTPVTLTFPSVQ